MPKNSNTPAPAAPEGPTLSNHPQQVAALAAAKAAGTDWRSARRSAIKLGHAYVLAVAVEGFDRLPLREDCEKQLGYAKLDAKDKNGVQKLFSDCVKCIDAWPSLPQPMRDDFIATGMTDKGQTYSKLAADIRERKAAKDKADAEQAEAEADAALTAELAEAGISREDYDAAEAMKEADASLIAAVTIILDAINSARPLSDEGQDAINKLGEAITAPAAMTGTNG